MLKAHRTQLGKWSSQRHWPVGNALGSTTDGAFTWSLTWYLLWSGGSTLTKILAEFRLKDFSLVFLCPSPGTQMRPHMPLALHLT
jgi:hypothetical protein